jgi:hypothetical protein
MKMAFSQSSRIPYVLLIITVVILAALTLIQCGGGGGSSDIKEDKWYPIKRAFPGVVSEDINGDGAIDIVFIEKGLYWRIQIHDVGADEDEETFDKLVIFLQDPFTAGSFTKQRDYPLEPEALSLSLGDLNQDNLVDVAVSQKRNNSVGVYLQNLGNPGLFIARRDYPAGNQPVGVAIDDLDGDSIKDIAVVGKLLALLINEAKYPGSIFTESSMDIPDATFITTADIDADSRNDLVFTSGNTVTVLFQDPVPATAGSYTKSDSYVSGADSTEVAIADLNGDSLLDLAIANNENDNGRVSVFFQDPLAIGSFLSPVHYDTDTRAVAIAIGHLNDDALLDMAVADNSKNGGSVAVLMQDLLNPGTFQPAELYSGNHGPDDVAIADLNQDGLDDLVVADPVDISSENDPTRWPYIRYQDASNPGTFLEPVYPVTIY